MKVHDVVRFTEAYPPGYPGGTLIPKGAEGTVLLDHGLSMTVEVQPPAGGIDVVTVPRRILEIVQ